MFSGGRDPNRTTAHEYVGLLRVELEKTIIVKNCITFCTLRVPWSLWTLLIRMFRNQVNTAEGAQGVSDLRIINGFCHHIKFFPPFWYMIVHCLVYCVIGLIRFSRPLFYSTTTKNFRKLFFRFLGVVIESLYYCIWLLSRFQCDKSGACCKMRKPNLWQSQHRSTVRCKQGDGTLFMSINFYTRATTYCMYGGARFKLRTTVWKTTTKRVWEELHGMEKSLEC